MKTVESEVHYSLIKILIKTVIPQANEEYWILTVTCINMVKNKFLLYIKNLEYLCHLVILINNDGNMYNEYG